MKSIKIGLIGVQHDYKQGVIPLIIQHLGYALEWVSPEKAEINIYGAFHQVNNKPYRWLPKPLRSRAISIQSKLDSRKFQPIRLFHTCESIRHDTFKIDYAISFDLGFEDPTHLRFPYWMEMIDWSHEGIVGNTNPRFGELLSLNKLKAPLGDAFLYRQQKAALITSHLHEPRNTLFKAVNRAIGVEGFGPYFDRAIKNHHQSNFIKKDLLQNFAFNLCPENSLYPGYYTEKIPESFSSGSIGLTWVDSNVRADFNPHAFINLEPLAYNNFDGLREALQSKKHLESFCDQPLILNQPSLAAAIAFMAKILSQTK